ncbi:hypothetical protein PR048_013760 [Dryococelus australis]|uniref:Uncharacterized protein n=1 Tax=Dryococelus australis TaxID=614101 RepID=A0ABQ9HTX8_9NEOP|nr:hypothetical protein PR048_013760 [Dryococelus australis]
MLLTGGFSRGYPVFSALSFRRCSALASDTLAVKSRPNLFTRSSVSRFLLQCVLSLVLRLQLSFLPNCSLQPDRGTTRLTPPPPGQYRKPSVAVLAVKSQLASHCNRRVCLNGHSSRCRGPQRGPNRSGRGTPNWSRHLWVLSTNPRLSLWGHSNASNEEPRNILKVELQQGFRKGRRYHESTIVRLLSRLKEQDTAMKLSSSTETFHLLMRGRLSDAFVLVVGIETQELQE